VRGRLNTVERKADFTARLKNVGAKAERDQLTAVATMSDAEKIEHHRHLQEEQEKEARRLEVMHTSFKGPTKPGAKSKQKNKLGHGTAAKHAMRPASSIRTASEASAAKRSRYANWPCTRAPARRRPCH
jgi:hypothetical protein